MDISMKSNQVQIKIVQDPNVLNCLDGFNTFSKDEPNANVFIINNYFDVSSNNHVMIWYYTVQ